MVGFKLPVIMPNERLAFKTALHTITGANQAEGWRIMWIKDTNHLREFYITERLLGEARKNAQLTVDETPLTVTYDEAGYFAGFQA